MWPTNPSAAREQPDPQDLCDEGALYLQADRAGTKVGTMSRMLKSGRFAKRRPKSPSITWVRARADEG